MLIKRRNHGGGGDGVTLEAPCCPGGAHGRWGSRRTTERGRLLAKTADFLGLVLINRGRVSTFSGNAVARDSIVELIFVSPAIAGNCRWRVSPSYTHSDTQAVRFVVDPQGQQQRQQQQRMTCNPQPRVSGAKWVNRRFNAETFAQALVVKRFTERTEDAQSLVVALARALTKRCPANLVLPVGILCSGGPRR
uniref:Uncharacterized protein n=1 Tax=Anopheles atroparvus TaxID=41427 RepID=A0A182J6V3_ANOAO